MCAQTGGAALAGAALIGAWGSERAVLYQGGGCFFDAAEVSSGQVLLNEVFSSFVLLYLAYGVGLDPRQAVLFGPRLGPLLVGITVGLLSFSSSGSVPGYSGAQMHPARCFAYGIARRDFSGTYSRPRLAAIYTSTRIAELLQANGYGGLGRQQRPACWPSCTT